MWERFSYYGMRALLVLYLVDSLRWSAADAAHLYGTYTGLIYLTPLAGGWLADRWLGTRRSLVLGGVVIALGHFSLALSAIDALGIPLFFAGLGLIIVGTGFFKPNVSTMVGQLYSEHDRRRDAGFTLFYMGINLGALLGTLVAGYLGEHFGWHYGFASAGVGMVLGLAVYLRGRDRYLPGIGLPIRYPTGFNARAPLTREEKERVAAVFITAFFVIFFWAAFEQAGASMSLFAFQHTDRWLAGFEIPASWFQSINPAAILVFAPAFATLWLRLGRRGWEPATPLKMALGLALLGLGFIPLVWAGTRVDQGALASPIGLVVAYLLHTWGELALSPTGLSLVTKLAPLQFASLLMGVWFLANAAANKLAGSLSALMPHPIPSATVTSAAAFETWQGFFSLFVLSSLAAALALLLLAPLLKRLIHGRD
jgi:POT family proton-dependent oligopeptide transporter